MGIKNSRNIPAIFFKSFWILCYIISLVNVWYLLNIERRFLSYSVVTWFLFYNLLIKNNIFPTT